MDIRRAHDFTYRLLVNYLFFDAVIRGGGKGGKGAFGDGRSGGGGLGWVGLRGL